MGAATLTPETAMSSPSNTSDVTNTMRIDTTRAASPVHEPEFDTSTFTYTHEEVRVLLKEAQSDGWEEGRKIGYEDGLEDGKDSLEDAKTQSYREGQDEG